MKNIFLIIGSLLFARCNSCSEDVKIFIPGTYVAEWRNEFAESKDTLYISLLSSDDRALYSITRRSRFNYVNKTKTHKPEYKMVHWTGIYDEKQRTISVQNTGRKLSFDPAKVEMKMGTITYKKL